MKEILLIFDCDGVLVETESVVTTLFCDAIAETDAGRRYLQQKDAALKFENEIRGLDLSRAMAAVCDVREKALPENFPIEFRKQLYQRLATHTAPVAGIHDALIQLDHWCCVASNGPQEKMQTSLTSAGLLSFFGKHLFSAYDIDSFKPHPQLFLHAANKMGASPKQCIVIEDSASGIEAAQAAHMRVVAFNQHGQLPSLWTAKADACISAMIDLPHTLHRIKQNMEDL